jgi:hypothetical protein
MTATHKQPRAYHLSLSSAIASGAYSTHFTEFARFIFVPPTHPHQQLCFFWKALPQEPQDKKMSAEVHASTTTAEFFYARGKQTPQGWE